jgi:XTP/dITP diphosphohydrolase
MRTLIVATNNPGKVQEIRRIFKDMPLEILSLKDIGITIEVEEDQESFAGNARKKAIEIAEYTSQPTLADDSGLEVMALKGQPGVYSARFAGENATDEENNIKLLKMMEGIPLESRGAVFRCAIALAYPTGKVLQVMGWCYGKIGFFPSGNGGFGYDPLFIVDGLGKTFAQLTPREKNRISHRGIALNKLKELLISQEILKGKKGI